MKILWILLALTFTATAEGRPMLKETPYAQVRDKIGKGKPYFLEIGSDSCRNCRIMGKLLYTITKEDPSLNIHFINVHKERSVASELKIMMIPTQLIFDANGTEVFRHLGVLSRDELNSLFKTHQF